MKQIIIIVLVAINIILCLGIYGIYYYENYYKDEANDFIDALEEDEKEDIFSFFVDVKGAVNNPGVYEVSTRNIINDVITIAGGLKKGAYTGNINLAKTVEKEMVIYVYTLSEYETLKKENKINKTTYDSKNYEKGLIEDNEKSESQDKLININNAAKEELMTLSGIGEAKAESIIAYRNENGNFSSIEEIKNVSGISEKIYEDIKNSITV